MEVEKAMLNIDNLVSAQLTCLEQHLDSKAEVKNRIIEAFHRFSSQDYTKIETPMELEEIPIPVLNLLRDKLGIALDVNDGKVTGFSVETATGFSAKQEY